MVKYDYRELVAAGALGTFGLWFAGYALLHYGRGTLEQVGDGLFPAGAGVLLAVLSLAMAVNAIVRPTARRAFNPRPLLWIGGGVAGFALVMPAFGLIPAVAAVTLLSSCAEGRTRTKSAMLLTLVLCASCYLIFRVGLGLAISLIDWPF